MKQQELFKWWLPGKGPRAKPYLSSWRMSRDDAAKRGALRPEESTREVIDVAETPEEAAQLRLRTDTTRAAADRGQSSA